jgi:hypothetical protein
MVAETCNAREGADVLSSISTAKAVGLLHFTRIAQRVRRARMFGMQEDGKLGSTSKRQSGELAARPFFAQRLKTQPCPLWELNDLGSGPAYALRSNVSGALICFRSANKQPAVAIGPGTGPIWEWMMLPMHWRSAAAFSRQLQATSAGQTPVGRSLPRRLKLSGL